MGNDFSQVQGTIHRFREMDSGWEFSICDLCGESDGEDILTLRHQDAPEGVAFIRQCQGCGLKRLWPRPGKEVIHQYYAREYGEMGRRRSPFKQAVWNLLRDGASGAPGRGRSILLPFRPAFRILAEKIFDLNVPLARDPLPRILDIGCGYGDLLLYWKSRGAETLGIDFSKKAVEVATRLGLKVLLGEIFDFELPMETFDVVVLNHSLEHMPSPRAVLQQAARLLKKGGSIYITVPNGKSAGIEIEKSSWEELSFPIHFWFFDSDTLTQILRNTGFELVRLDSKNMWRNRLARSGFNAKNWSTIVRILKYKLKEISGDFICAIGNRN